MADQKCNVSLHQKIADRAGRLQLLVGMMAQLAHDIDHDVEEEIQGQLAAMVYESGPQWLDECSMLLKELYNRERGS